VVISVSPR